jgi:glycosyltransferase involved in cell wall biosynthesis
MSGGVTAIILTRDEEVHIERCIQRLKPLADRIIVVDSFSKDATVKLAKAAGAEIWEHEFRNHALQFQWALDTLAQVGGWIVRIDADEWFEDRAIAEIRRRIAESPADVSAFDFRRKVMFRGRWIRWGGYYQTILTRVWRGGSARIEQRWMDEHIVIEQGRVERLSEGDIVDENLKDITSWTEKHNSYATRQMVEYVGLEQGWIRPRSPGRLSNAAKWKRFLRNNFYARFPLYLRAYLYFVWRYLFRLGFLDGRQGLVFHTLQGFWSFFLVDAKVDEARDFIRRHGAERFRKYLDERHQIALDDRRP